MDLPVVARGTSSRRDGKVEHVRSSLTTRTSREAAAQQVGDLAGGDEG
jgi:hypothetical protein